MRTIKNIGYRGVAQAITFGLQSATAVVLARYLSARDYGIVGYAAIFVSLLARFSDMGLDSAMVQRKEADDRATNVAFTLRLLLGGAAFAAAIAAGRIAELGFRDPVIGTVIVVLCLDFLISSLGYIPRLLLVRALDYKRWIQPMIGAAVVSAAVACWLAVHGFGFWSIVIAGVASSVTQNVWYARLVRVKLRFQWDRVLARELLRFSLPLVWSGLLVFALFNMDNFIVGTVSGAALLGYYAIAFNWGARTSTLSYDVIHSVLFPTMAKMQDDKAQLKQAYLRVMEQLSVVGLLLQVGLLCCAKPFLVLVLGGGGKWLPALHALQILCLYGAVRLLTEPLGNVLVALGRTKLLFRANLLAALCEVLLVYPALRLGGIDGVALIVTLAYGIQWLVFWPFVRTEMEISVSDFKMVLLPALVAGVCACIAGVAVESALPLGFPTFGVMIITITLVFLGLQGSLSSWRWLDEWKQLYWKKLRSARRGIDFSVRPRQKA